MRQWHPGGRPGWWRDGSVLLASAGSVPTRSQLRTQDGNPRSTADGRAGSTMEAVRSRATVPRDYAGSCIIPLGGTWR